MQCPKCGYEPTMSEMQTTPDECPKCGVYYAKVRPSTDSLGTADRSPKRRLSDAWHGAKVSVEEGRRQRAERDVELAHRHSMERASPVVVVDIKMSFWSMVIFMVKWAIAAIPALLILALIAGLASSILIAIPKFFEYRDRAAAAKAAPTSVVQEQIQIPSDPAARYFLVDLEYAGTNAVITTRRDGQGGSSYSRRFVDCRAGTGKYLGVSDTLAGLDSSPPDPGMSKTLYESIAYYVSRRACQGIPIVHPSLK